VALIYNNEVKKVFGVFPKIRGVMKPAHESLEYGKEYGPVCRHLVMFADGISLYAQQSILRKRLKIPESLVGKYIAVGKK
jgi:hypothetical protein